MADSDRIAQVEALAQTKKKRANYERASKGGVVVSLVALLAGLVASGLLEGVLSVPHTAVAFFAALVLAALSAVGAWLASRQLPGLEAEITRLEAVLGAPPGSGRPPRRWLRAVRR